MRSSLPRTFAVWSGVAIVLAWAITIGCTSFAGDSPVADDAQSPDAQSPDAQDGGGASDAAAPFSCDHVEAAFCDDFENLPLGARWGPDALQIDAGALTLVDGSTGASLYALRSTVLDLGPVDGGKNGFAELQHVQARDLSRPVIIVEADLRVDALADPGPGLVSAITLFFGDDRSLVFVLDANGYGALVPFRADAGPSIDPQHIFSLPPTHTWFHLRIEADLSAQVVSAYVDGALRVDKASGVISTEAQYTVLAGAYAAPAHGPTDVSFDNFTITSR